jgi:Flp pilus assembly protein TadG
MQAGAIMPNAIGPQKKRRGSISLTFLMMLVLLLGFMGVALDFGHLFVVRTELQTAMDSCALAAAQELNGQPDAIARARNAGIAAGNINRVNLQSATWSGKAQLAAADITFRDNAHNATTDSAQARFVRCDHVQAGTATPLLHVLSLQSSSQAYAATMDVRAFAEATTAPSQSTCPMPLGLVPRNNTPPDYGFVKGEWITLLSKNNPNPGQIGWLNLNPDGSKGAPAIEDQLKGICGIRTDDPVLMQGVKQSVADTWNTRFGIYKVDGPSVQHPDFTGYVYNQTVPGNGKNKPAPTWPTGHDAYSDFVAKRQTFTGCASSFDACVALTGVNDQRLASSGPGGDLQTYGTNRRLVTVPIITSSAGGTIKDFACMLLLQPIPTPFADVQLEYRGNASQAGSPCTGSGLPGGTAGPLVPVLVR